MPFFFRASFEISHLRASTRNFEVPDPHTSCVSTGGWVVMASSTFDRFSATGFSLREAERIKWATLFKRRYRLARPPSGNLSPGLPAVHAASPERQHVTG